MSPSFFERFVLSGQRSVFADKQDENLFLFSSVRVDISKDVFTVLPFALEFVTEYLTESAGWNHRQLDRFYGEQEA